MVSNHFMERVGGYIMIRVVQALIFVALAMMLWTFSAWWEPGNAHAQPTAVPTKIVINVATRQLYLYRNHKLFQTYPVAVGKPTTPSPRGEFFVTQKAIWGDGFGTRWMRISVPWGIYGIHGTNKPWSVGTVASHGCFRMLNRDVEQVYALVAVGTPVIIQGPTPYAAIRRTLTPGAIGQDVVELQRLLRVAKIYDGPLSGIYTTQVAEAVKAFQTLVGLPPTDNLNTATLDKLRQYTQQSDLRAHYLVSVHNSQ
jgi:hypothetical protein